MRKFHQTHPILQDLIVFTFLFFINSVFVEAINDSNFKFRLGNTFGYFIPYYVIKLIVYFIGLIMNKGKSNWPNNLIYYIIPIGLMIFILYSEQLMKSLNYN